MSTVRQAELKAMIDLFPSVPRQADAIYDMIGFPEFILDPKELDDVYDGVRASFQYSVIHLQPGRTGRQVDEKRVFLFKGG